MITEYIRYKISKDNISKFVADYKKASEALSRWPFCKGYDLTQCAEDQELLTLRILWTSAKDHLEGFRSSSEFKDFFREIKPYVGNILEMKHYEFTNVV